MTLKKRLESAIRGWFPKEPKMPRDKVKMAETKVSKPKPWWWKPLWIGTILLTIISGVATYFLLDVPLARAVIGIVLTFLCIGIAYYIRVRPSMKVNRAIYILLGVTPIGFTLWIIWAVSGIGRWITEMVGSGPSLLISWVVCYGIGAFIGDWIGKSRNYILPMTP